MKEILLVSDDEELFKLTRLVTEQKYKMIWRDYSMLKKNDYPDTDVVILHFNNKMIEKDIFEPIIRIRGKLGHDVPILVIVQGGTIQEIFSILQIGAYDYMDESESIQKYQNKIKELIRWNWYLHRYSVKKGED